MGLKEDADFARYLTMGAYGAAHVKQDLEARGHRIVELERYAMANKVWSEVKVKRLRLPDLMCVDCGRRFEAKSKSKLELKLSHSSAVGREWWAGGMRPDDVFAFVRVAVTDGEVDLGQILYVTRQGLEDASADRRKGGMKAASEGSETDVSWPIWVPSYPGVFTRVDLDPETIIRVQKTDGRLMSRARGKWSRLHLYLRPGDSFEAGRQAIAGTVAAADVTCPGHTWDWRTDLLALDSDTSFAAVKAARVLDLDEPTTADLDAIFSGSDDWRLQLEALAVLAAHHPDRYLPSLIARASDTSRPDPHQMEAVFILSELAFDAAVDGLLHVAEPALDRKDEIRAAALWGVGLGAQPRPEALLPYLADPDDRVALHAAAALPEQLPAAIVAELQRILVADDGRAGSAAASVLASHREALALLDIAVDEVAVGRMRAIRALGDLPPGLVRTAAGGAVPEMLELMLGPLWAAQSDWLRTDENDGVIGLLQRQRVRF